MLAAAEKLSCRPSCGSRSSPLASDDIRRRSKLAWKVGVSSIGQVPLGRAQLPPRLAKDPENLSAMNGLGFLLLNSGKTAEAKVLSRSTSRWNPMRAGPMNGLARCLKEEGKVDEAIALWEKMDKKYPGPNAATVRPRDDVT